MSEFSNIPFELREDFIYNGTEPRAEEPTLVEVCLRGLTPAALKWFGGTDPKKQTKEQFFFSVFPPDIPEWEMIGLSEWCVVGIGQWKDLQGKFPKAAPIPCEPEDWVIAIAVNHNLTDFSNRDMFGRPYFAKIATRTVGSGQHVRHIVPQEFVGETCFRPIEAL